MNGSDCLSAHSLEGLVAEKGAAAPAWFTRAHHELARRCPDDFVFRMAASLEDLLEWLDALQIPREEETLLRRISFDYDRAGPRTQPEGGWLAFTWDGTPFRVLSVRVPGPRRNETYTWVSCPAQAQGEALVAAVARHERRQTSSVMVFEDGDWEDAPRVASDLSRYAWDSVVLTQADRDRLRGTTEIFFRSRPVYQELGIPWKLGYLFVGPPGTGKTLTTKVLAATSGVPFLYVRGLCSFCENKPDASTVRDMFRGARERGPCILCLEDVDSLVTEDLRSTFLNELDGLDEDQLGVLTVATTNHPDRLDPAMLLRPCRFDYRFEFPLPDEAQRRAFVRHWTERLASLRYVDDPSAGVDEIARKSHGMSQAYLKRILLVAVMRMHTQEERGDTAFVRLALAELADANGDRALARRSQTSAPILSGGRVGFGFDA